jgi:predicted restriction endonuclease
MIMDLIDDNLATPSLELMEEKIGKNYKIFDSILKYLNENYEGIHIQWKHYGEKYGWTLKVFLKKRNLFFITPREGYFNISFVFGDKAVEKVKESDIAHDIKELLHQAKKYVEGTGIKLEVKSREDLLAILILIEIKIEN